MFSQLCSVIQTKLIIILVIQMNEHKKREKKSEGCLFISTEKETSIHFVKE